MALLRKGGHTRLSEYGRGKPVDDIVFGLAWDVTNGAYFASHYLDASPKTILTHPTDSDRYKH